MAPPVCPPHLPPPHPRLQLFLSSGLEASPALASGDLANQMGLFLQKTNIIRDYLEDIMEEPAPRWVDGVVGWVKWAVVCVGGGG